MTLTFQNLMYFPLWMTLTPLVFMYICVAGGEREHGEGGGDHGEPRLHHPRHGQPGHRRLGSLFIFSFLEPTIDRLRLCTWLMQSVYTGVE